MKPMETLQDLIEEAKVRTLWWAICVFGFSYLLSLTSKSAWTNIPISILILSVFRFLLYEVEIRRRVRPVHKQTYLSHLEKKQLPVDDPCLSAPSSVITGWNGKFGSPLIEAAINDFINKLLQDFVIDLWYSSITPDTEAPELIHKLINDVLGEISERLKEINLVDLLTRDMVDLIGNHLDLYRRNQALIGVNVMGTLSFEERDAKLKNHLMVSKELHPALISSECEYKVLKRLMGGVLAIVLRRQEAQCPLVHCFARELLTCLVMQPLMNLASPGYINELIEYLVLNAKADGRDLWSDKSTDQSGHQCDNSVAQGLSSKGEPDSRKIVSAANQKSAIILSKSRNHGEETLNIYSHGNLPPSQAESERCMQPKPADWARVLDAARERRTQVLAPENLENLWTKGRNYKSKSGTHDKTGNSLGLMDTRPPRKLSGTINNREHPRKSQKETTHESLIQTEDKYVAWLMHGSSSDAQVSGREQVDVESRLLQDVGDPSFEGGHLFGGQENTIEDTRSKNTHIKRSSSTPALENQWDIGKTLIGEGGDALASKEFRNQDLGKHKEVIDARNISGLLLHTEETLHVPKIKCRVVGAYFEKVGSKSFAVYSIAVTTAENKTWFVKRRYRNFERLHRHLKDIPNYTLHLPPKRFLSSSIDDYFVHQRCILLDKYLKDLLSIANVAEQHEVWDFLSATSKNYSFGKSTSVMKTLAVNVDDAVDDIVRQFKGVSDGLLRKVSGSSPSSYAVSPGLAERDVGLPWNEEDISKHTSSYSHMGSSHSHSLSEDEGTKDGAQDELGSTAQINGWHSDSELKSKSFPPRVIKRSEQQSGSLGAERSQQSGMRLERLLSLDGQRVTGSFAAFDLYKDPVRVPPEWTPPKVSVPLLNLVDKIFQLNRRGWLRRQVFWISKQILQLVMEDAIDDWLLRQIHWLRRDDIIAQGIRWVQDVLWPNGTFFLKEESNLGEMGDDEYCQVPRPAASRAAGDKSSAPASFELQLEAARRASDVKKLILGGAPTALVSLIGNKQYQRCAKDIYFFLQSTICIKQLAYGVLEQLLVSVFPELHDLILDVHDKMHI